MSKVRLLESEAIVYEGKVNPLFFGTAVMALLSLLVSFAAPPLGIFLLLCCGLSGIRALIKYKTSIFLITNKRVIIRVGAITHRTLELNLNKVESVYVQTGFLERINRMGTLIVSGTGGTKEAFKELADPETFKLKLQEQLDTIALAHKAG